MKKNSKIIMKHVLTIFGFLLLILFVCTHVQLVVAGTQDGLSIWYNNLIPIVLPFLLISGYFVASLDLTHLNHAQSIIIILITGLFCGYPVGAIVIGQLYREKRISKALSYAFMPLCNNVSPMFLIGYVYQEYIQNQLSLINMLTFIYLPQIMYIGIFLFCHHMFLQKTAAKNSHTPEINRDLTNEVPSSVMENSVSTITMIGLYIIIFSIITEIVTYYNVKGLISVQIVAGFLEITKGIPYISQLSYSLQIKTALILSLTSLGGISSIFQSVHVLKESKLSFIPYVFGKTICSLFTFIIICLF